MDAAVRHLLDRVAIEDAIRRYARGCDESDAEALHAAFTDDARARYGDGDVITGSVDIVAWLMARAGETIFSQHVIVPQLVSVGGATAEATAQLVARQVFAHDPDTRLLTSGRYEFGLRRASEGWCIADLTLVVGWLERTRA